ncbi:uncharacterized protein LOC143171289 isoform X4 [Aptenodytes patagonicus]|uniref:uncharacterized protein LOC143171289 isoform X4 n=1 Tax=Aptenodytes patagonicus TaxID=9234 RepID=UPI003FA15542
MKRKRKITALEAPNPPLSPLPGRLPAVSLLEEEENGEQVLVKNESYLPILKNKDQRKRLVRETFSFLDSSQPSEIERRSGEIPNCLNGTNFWYEELKHLGGPDKRTPRKRTKHTQRVMRNVCFSNPLGIAA